MSQLNRDGCVELSDFFGNEECWNLLDQINLYRKNNHLPEIHRQHKARSLRYRVIDGHVIHKSFADIWDLYNNRVLDVIREHAGPSVHPIENKKVGVNVNIMVPQRSEYRWHYDRNALTAILYLNEVEGGETELYPNYRLFLGNNGWLRLQQFLDKLIHFPPIRGLFCQKKSFKPQTGKLIIMRGNRCWHSVSPIRGSQDRINLNFVYDDGKSKSPA